MITTQPPLYHYTDTVRLPFILASGNLKPGRNRVPGFPPADFLWATTSSVGDRTAAPSMDAFKSGLVRYVRFVLDPADFEMWSDVPRSHPEWTRSIRRRLESAARGRSDPRDWRCRSTPLPADRWISIEIRSWTDPIWRPFTDENALVVYGPRYLGLQLGDKIYRAKQDLGPHGLVTYSASVLAVASLPRVEEMA